MTSARERVAESLDRVLQQAVTDPAVPGAIAAVKAPGIGLDWSGAVGGDLPGGGGPRLTADRAFRIASVTKLYVAAALMRLVETGRVDLHGSIETALSAGTAQQLVAAGFAIDRITSSHLLSHTSGLPDHVARPGYRETVVADPRRRWTRRDQVAIAVRDGPLAAPGTAFQYSDTGYVLVGEMLECLTGEPLAIAVRRLLDYDRAGLTQTYWEQTEPAPADAPPRARQYLGATDATDFDPSFDLFGGGGLVATVADLCTFVRALLCAALFEQPGTLAAALEVPPARRDAGAYVHSHLAMMLPLGRRYGWAHLGFWGCIAAWIPELDIAMAATIDQATPSTDGLLLSLAGALADVTARAVTG